MNHWFRLVVCQLDTLKRLNSVPEIRLALKTLPKTLDETYERILCNIPHEQHKVAHRTLNLIASGYMITLEEISDLLVINLKDHSFDHENRLLDTYAPLEACMGLLTHSSETDVLSLAHYTVKEYLESSRIWSSPAKAFGMSEESIYLVTGSCLLVYMLHANDGSKEMPAMTLALEYWGKAVRTSKLIGIALAPLVIQLLDPTRPNFQTWLSEMAKTSMLHEICPTISCTVPGSERYVTLGYLCMFDMPEAVRLFLSSQTEIVDFQQTFTSTYHPSAPSPEDGRSVNATLALLETLDGGYTGYETFSLLELATKQFGGSILELFIIEGADVNACQYSSFNLLTTALSSRHLALDRDIRFENAEILLAHKADPNAGACAMTPLQSLLESITYQDWLDEGRSTAVFQISRKLLESGANVNAVACDRTRAEKIRLTSHYCFERYPWAFGGKEEQLTAVAFAISTRGESEFYSTPLRMIQTRKTNWIEWFKIERDNTTERDEAEKRIYKLVDLLTSYGAKSLHLFPVKDLPGYVAEDMDEWDILNRLKI